MTDVMAWLLDLANVVGGFLLAAVLLREVPRIGAPTAGFTARAARFGYLVGVLELVAGGYWLIVHLASGPHVFHFEVVGLAVGLILLRERLLTRSAWTSTPTAAPPPPSGTTPYGPAPFGQAPYGGPAAPTAPVSAPAAAPAVAPPGAPLVGAQLLLAVFGVIAIVVGVQGMFTPN